MLALVVITAVTCLGVVVLAPGNNSDVKDAPSPAQMSNICGTDRPIHKGLAESTNPQLRKLAQYEAACAGAFTERHMLFTHMPATADEATGQAATMAGTLKEFAAYDVSPLVIFEPTDSEGTLLSLEGFSEGLYDAALAKYFQALKDEGVTDEMMGMWVPFPEANTPAWETTDPTLFARNITHVVGLQKQYFPDSKASILLDSKSYPDDDPEWRRGKHVSLKPYLRDIGKGLIDSFGLQGFPWKPVANDPDQSNAILKAEDYLRPHLAKEAAETLGVKHVWFNTGTFDRAHTGSEETMVSMDAQERETILRDVIKQAKRLKEDSLTVAIHVFAEDKSKKKEGVDWSYWQSSHPGEGDSADVFRDFVREAQLSSVPVWLYDSAR